MTNEVFAASQQWMGFWTKAAEDHMARAQAMTEEWTGKSLSQTTAAVDEMSKLTKESLAYGSQLGAEWRKLCLETMKKGAVSAV